MDFTKYRMSGRLWFNIIVHMVALSFGFTELSFSCGMRCSIVGLCIMCTGLIMCLCAGLGTGGAGGVCAAEATRAWYTRNSDVSTPMWRCRLDPCGVVWGKVAEVLSLMVLDAYVAWASVIGP